MASIMVSLVLGWNVAGATKLAPVPVASLVRESEIIVRVKPTKDLHRPAVQEVIWSSIGQPGRFIDLAPDDPIPKGTTGEGTWNGVYCDSIVFLHRVRRGDPSSKPKGAFVCIPFHLNQCACREDPIKWRSPSVLKLDGGVYFSLPLKRKHGSSVSYAEVKSAILELCRHNARRLHRVRGNG